jgi:hypothetical protein
MFPRTNIGFYQRILQTEHNSVRTEELRKNRSQGHAGR